MSEAEAPERPGGTKETVIFYHAGCPICVGAEASVSAALDPAQFGLEAADLARDRRHRKAAAAAGVKSIPAVVLRDRAFHLHQPSDLEALRAVGKAAGKHQRI